MNSFQIFRALIFQEKGHRTIYIITQPWSTANPVQTLKSHDTGTRGHCSVQLLILEASFHQGL